MRIYDPASHFFFPVCVYRELHMSFLLELEVGILILHGMTCGCGTLKIKLTFYELRK